MATREHLPSQVMVKVVVVTDGKLVMFGVPALLRVDEEWTAALNAKVVRLAREDEFARRG